MKQISILLGFLLLTACAAPAVNTTETVSTITPVEIEGKVATATERAACDKAGGIVERQGLMGYERCVIPYPDAGKACTDASDCMGRCFADPSLNDGNTMIATSGVCEPDNNPFGCYATIEDGQGSPMLCVD